MLSEISPAWLLHHVPPLEAAAALLGLICVVLYIRRNILCWPVGLGQTCLYAYLFVEARLYSDAGLQAIFVVLQVYGWWNWAKGAGRGAAADEPGAIVRLSAPGAVIVTLSVLAATAVLGTLTAALGAALPYVDAFGAALSLAAQLLIGRKVLESWLLWITVDVVSIGIYLDRGLYVTAALYGVFLVLACRGYIAWWRAAAPSRAMPAATAP